MRTDVRPRRGWQRKTRRGSRLGSAKGAGEGGGEGGGGKGGGGVGEASLFTNNKVQAGAKEDGASLLADWMDGNSRNANSAPSVYKTYCPGMIAQPGVDVSEWSGSTKQSAILEAHGISLRTVRAHGYRDFPPPSRGISVCSSIGTRQRLVDSSTALHGVLIVRILVAIVILADNCSIEICRKFFCLSFIIAFSKGETATLILKINKN